MNLTRIGCVCMAVLAVACPAQVEAAPEVWMCHRNAEHLVAEDAEWSFVQEHLDGIQFYIDRLNGYDEETLAKLAAMVAEHNLKVSVECGGTLDFGPMDETNGRWSAEHEMAKIAGFVDAGGRIDFLNLDGPIRRLMYSTDHREGLNDLDACVEQLIVYMQTVHAEYPDIEFFLLTNFPNWGWKGDVSYHARGPERMDWGDYYPVVEKALSRTREAGIPFRGLTVDNPYGYAIGTRPSVNLEDPTSVDWMGRIRELQDYVTGLGYEFNMIINDEEGGGESDAAFREGTLAFLDLFMETGPAPTRYIIQSWYVYPEAVVPETNPDSMTGLVRESIRRVKGMDE